MRALAPAFPGFQHKYATILAHLAAIMRPDSLLRLIPVSGYLALQGLLIADVVRRGTGCGKAAVVSLLASLTLWFLFSFADCIRREGSLHIESHWGGLGGGVGGFRISRSLIYLAGTLCFSVLLVLAFLNTTPDTQAPSAGAKNDESKRESPKPEPVKQDHPSVSPPGK